MPSIRATAAACLLVALLAGCAQTPAPPSASTSAPPPAYTAPPVPKMDGAWLEQAHAAFVSSHKDRAGNSAAHEAARQDLMAQFRSFGLDVYRMNFTDGIPQANIVGIKWGLDRQHWVVVGGHYDIIDRPECADCPAQAEGAYDNGSGTMITVALARAYANVTTQATIAFVGMDGEERGTQGASAFVDDIMAGNATFGAVTFAGELDIDMLGLNWPGVNAPVDIITNSHNTSALIHARAKAIGFPDDQLVDKPGITLGSSDYVHFWRLDDPPVPTVFLISDFEELGSPQPAPEQLHGARPAGIYPFWHQEDTLATMRAMAGDPPADGVPHPHVVAGFQAAADLTAQVIHFMAAEPETHLDATVMK